MKKRIKLQGFLIFLSVTTLVLLNKRLLPPGGCGNSARVFIDGLGVILLLSGYCLRVMARGYKAELNPDGKTLIKNGPYALTRNPMYLGTLLIGLGIILLLLKWWTAFVFMAVYLAIYIPEIKKEEKKLSSAFGSEFHEYCKVPRFLPSLESMLVPNKDTQLQFKPGWVKKEIPSIVPTFLFVCLVKVWECHYL